MIQKTSYVQLWLACADNAESDTIARNLLEKRLIACAKRVPVSSDFIWEGEIDHNDEVLLIMESREDLFDQVEAEVKKLHSYETFVLQAIPMVRISAQAQEWLSQSIQKY